MPDTQRSFTPAQARPGISLLSVLTGCITAPVVYFGMSVIFSIIDSSSESSNQWFPLTRLLLSLFWTFVTVVLGGIIGAIAGRTRSTVAGAMIGIALSTAVEILIALLIPAETSWDNYIWSWIHAVVPCALAGALAGLVARNLTQPVLEGTKKRLTPIDAATIFGLLVVVAGWCGKFCFEAKLHSEIKAAGGVLTLTFAEDRQGVWEGSFPAGRLGDAEFEKLIPALAWYPRLDLDLGHSGLTDASLPKLARLPNLLRLRFYDCPVSEEGITKLKHDLPNVAILREPRADRSIEFDEPDDLESSNE